MKQIVNGEEMNETDLKVKEKFLAMKNRERQVINKKKNIPLLKSE